MVPGAANAGEHRLLWVRAAGVVLQVGLAGRAERDCAAPGFFAGAELRRPGSPGGSGASARGVDAQASHRGGSTDRVPCCAEGQPPIVDVDLRDRIEAAFKAR
jgi:hypothetical protein